MRRYIYLFMTAALLLMAVVACTPAGGEPGVTDTPPGDTTGTTDDTPAAEATETGGLTLEALEGTTWVLDSYGPADNPTTPLPNTTPTLTFQDMGSINGHGSCNSYFGEITLDGNNVTISGVGSTEMACTDAGVMEQESAYFSALTAAKTIAREGDTLTITYDGGELHYTMQQPTPNASLRGTEWQLNSFIAGDSASSLISDTAITAIFNEDGTVGGSAGCNDYGGTYQTDGETLTIGELTQTLKLCDDEGLMNQETTFVDAMQTAESYSVEGNQLTINYPGGSLVFSAVQ